MRSAFERRGVRVCAVELLVAAGVLAHAADGRAAGSDATYGRVGGDVTLVAGVGVVAADGGPRGEAELRARYLQTAGLFASYEDAPLLGSSAEPRRVFAAGLEVRPLFLFRWLDGHQTSNAWFDLVVDSLGLELGATFEQPSGASFASRPGAQVGLGVEVPVLATATGPWIGLHGGIRWSDSALAGGAINGPDDRSLYLSITLAWHQVILLGVVDVGDGPAR
jgi:hypothetical protein